MACSFSYRSRPNPEVDLNSQLFVFTGYLLHEIKKEEDMPMSEENEEGAVRYISDHPHEIPKRVTSTPVK